METTPSSPVPQATLSPWQRLVAIFFRPSAAWAGLETRSQWWFPLILLMVLNGGLAALLFERAIVPMQVERMQAQVDSGAMTPADVERMEAQMASPVSIVIGAVFQGLAWAVILMLSALALWFTVGFILGTKFRYRLALEVTGWSALVLIPAQLIGSVLAWSKQTFDGIHLGLGILVPESDPPSKLLVGLAAFLDAFGPFALWSLWLTVLGATALSGAPRKSVLPAVVVMYLVVSAFLAAMAALFTPGG